MRRNLTGGRLSDNPAQGKQKKKMYRQITAQELEKLEIYSLSQGDEKLAKEYAREYKELQDRLNRD